MMKDLVRVQLYETALWKWLLLLCLVFGAINISLTSYLSAEFSNAQHMRIYLYKQQTIVFWYPIPIRFCFLF